MHLLDGGFQSAPYFWLQAAGTYLADFHPSAFALIDLTAYHNLYLGKRHLKDEVNTRFPDSHSFLYRGDVFLFLHGDGEKSVFADVVKEFQLKVVISEGLGDLFSLPALYRTAHEALELMRDERFHSGNICTAAYTTAAEESGAARRPDLPGCTAACRPRQGKKYAVL